MLHPVGKLPPTVYWKRRLILLGLPILFVVLMLFALLSGGDGKTASARPTTTPAPSTTRPAVASRASTTPGSSAPPSATVAAVPLCTAAMLAVTAATGQASYPVGTQPELFMVVTNVSAKPCRQDLADPQIELIVFTGDVRVWGSRDCNPQSGTDIETLVPAQPVRRAVIWSGQTSAPNCAGVRLVSAAGTYTLYSKLAGKQSPATTFVLAASQ